MTEPNELLAKANETFRAAHGHEDPAYLYSLLQAAHRQAAAIRQVIDETYKRYQAANVAEWAKITDAEIMASEHLRKRLLSFADREHWAAKRMRELAPKCPLGRTSLHDVSKDGEPECWLPTFEAYTLEREISEEKRAESAEAIRELGRLWAFGRRLIKIGFMCPDLGEVGYACWIEYEPETEQGRVMTEANRFAEAEQLVYGPVAELVSAAIDHVQLLEGRWDSVR